MREFVTRFVVRTRVSRVSRTAPAAASIAPVAEEPVVAEIGVVRMDAAARGMARIVGTDIAVVAIDACSYASAVGAMIAYCTDAEVVAGPGVVDMKALARWTPQIVRTEIAVEAKVTNSCGIAFVIIVNEVAEFRCRHRMVG